MNDLYCNLLAFETNKTAGVKVALGDKAILFQPASMFRHGSKTPQLVLTQPPQLRREEKLTAETASLTDPEKIRFQHGLPVYANVADMVRETLRAEKLLSDINHSKHLSADGVHDKRREIIEAGALPIALANSNVQIQRYAAEVARGQAELYAVPRAADAVEAMGDREVRDLFRSMSGDGQMRMLAELRQQNFAGQIIPALMRSPAPLGLSDVVQELVAKAWITRIDAEKPERAARQRAEDEIAAWAVTSARGIASWAQANSLTGDKPTIFRVVRNIPGGPQLFGFSDNEVEFFTVAIPA